MLCGFGVAVFKHRATEIVMKRGKFTGQAPSCPPISIAIQLPPPYNHLVNMFNLFDEFTCSVGEHF